MNKRTKDIFVIGFALFAMFFGAGNLIFPPALGQSAGENLILTVIGFLLTGVGLPLIGIITISKFNGDLELLASKSNKHFAKILTFVVILLIGPLVAIPRTSATTYEMAISPLFPNFSAIIFSAIYFSIVLAFVLKPSSIIDKIGKILTPILLITMITIITRGILYPAGDLVDTGLGVSFSNGFVEGYQTMDVMAATIFGGIVVAGIKQKGYKSAKEVSRLTAQAGIVAAIGLSIIYTGLAYLGATAGDIPMDTSRSELIITITNNLLGNFGQVLLGIAVGMACLTTSIGLTATSGKYFSKISKGKLSYEKVVMITVTVSMLISNLGVDSIVNLASPLLMIIYPIIIVLVILGLVDKYISNQKVYTVLIFSTLILSIINTFNIVEMIQLIGNNIIK